MPLRLLLLTAALLAASSAVAQTGAIQGRVLAADLRQPLPGVTVVLEGTAYRAATDADGTFSLAAVPAGGYTLTATFVGYRTVQRAIDVQSGETVRVDLVLDVADARLGEVVVGATRLAIPLSAVSGAVTVVSEEEIATQEAVSLGLGEILAQSVPGLGVGTGTPSNYGQTLRGRSIAVLIDGVPQSTTRNTSRDLTTIDPAVVERVEVIRGATALYGDNATGGIVNIITKQAAGAEPRFTTSAQVGGSAASPGDGLRTRLAQTASGRAGALDYTASGVYGRTTGFYDAEGDLVPPDPYGQGGLAYTTSYDLHGRVGYTAGPHRVTITANQFWAEQETSLITDPSVNAEAPGTEKARVMSGLDLQDDQGSRNTLASLDYRHADLLGGTLRTQAYARDYFTRFNPFDGRAFGAYGAIIQSYLESTKLGARVEFERALHAPTALRLLVGSDLTAESTQQPVSIIDPETYDASGGLVYESTGQRPWVPLLAPRQLGLFAQASWSPLAWLDLQGGLRYERARLQIDDFTTLVGSEVTGGELAFDPVLVNVGAVVHPTEATSLYASFSQGFSLTDIGLFLRSAPDGFVVGGKTLEAQTVNNWEAGARGALGPVRASLAGFYNTSDLGTTSAGLNLAVVRAPERVYGVEATLDVSPVRSLDLGGTFSWTEGDYDPNEDGVFSALNSFRIQPFKATGYLQHQTGANWTNRLQVLVSGDRDRGFDLRPVPDRVGFGERPVDGYVVLDLISELGVGPGTLRFGVENLLNSQYYPVVSQLLWNGANSSYAAAPGMTLSVGYTVTY